MGLFDKLKQATNFITGGGATVHIMPEKAEFDRSAPIKAKVTTQIKDAPINASMVCLEIRSKESVSLKKNINGKNESITEERIGFTHKVQTPLTIPLEGSKSYEWEMEITLPPQVQPTFHGTMSHHTWEIMGALDVKGNDPDSGWVEIRLK